MSDEGDISRKVVERGLEKIIEDQKAAADSFEAGHAGHCDGCYEYFERVVTRGGNQYCGRCRDKLGIK